MALDENNLEKKLENVSNSQESIQSLSLWILHHKNHHKRIVQIWMKALRKAKASHRLTLFYLANDVIQHARRKNINVYVEEFGQVLKEATDLVKEDRIKSSVCRVFNIWQERSVYPAEFIEELKAILSGSGNAVFGGNTSKIVAEFKLTPLIEKIKKLKKIESYVKSKMDSINCSKLDALSYEVLNHLKDKSHGEQFSKDFDEATKHLETIVHTLEKEISIRNELIETLEKSEIFYGIQKEEAKIVANAYKNFAVRVKSVKRKLCDSKQSLPSPLPSPSVDAPSPTNSDDGPLLPGMESSLNDIKALMNVFTDGSSNNGQISSLDKRLSNLMQNIPMAQSDLTVSDYGLNQSNTHLPVLQQVSQLQGLDNWNVHSQGLLQQPYFQASKYVQPPPPPPPPPPIPSVAQNLTSQDLYSQITSYDYDYCHSVTQVNDAYCSDPVRGIQPQPIQAVISSRSDILNDAVDVPTNLRQYDNYSNLSSQQARENFEPADMDLGNSDDDEGSMRLQNHQRVLKVIETRRVPSHYSSDKPVNESPYNSHQSMHHIDPNDQHQTSNAHLKSGSRLPPRQPSSHSSDERHRWRNVRPSSITPPHFESNQHQNQSRQWKQSPRNPHNRGSFSRRY